MSREIKFKFYDKASKSLIDIYDMWWNYIEFLSPEDVIVCQFTGLIDANAKDVYEGDILKITNPFTQRSVIRTVWWNEETARFNGIPNSVVNIFEVIGNIYENPEPLTKEEKK